MVLSKILWGTMSSGMLRPRFCSCFAWEDVQSWFTIWTKSLNYCIEMHRRYCRLRLEDGKYVAFWLSRIIWNTSLVWLKQLLTKHGFMFMHFWFKNGATNIFACRNSQTIKLIKWTSSQLIFTFFWQITHLGFSSHQISIACKSFKYAHRLEFLII